MSTNAAPQSAGSVEKKIRNASSPPAEAPMPTIGKVRARIFISKTAPEATAKGPCGRSSEHHAHEVDSAVIGQRNLRLRSRQRNAVELGAGNAPAGTARIFHGNLVAG